MRTCSPSPGTRSDVSRYDVTTESMRRNRVAIRHRCRHHGADGLVRRRAHREWTDSQSSLPSFVTESGDVIGDSHRTRGVVNRRSVRLVLRLGRGDHGAHGSLRRRSHTVGGTAQQLSRFVTESGYAAGRSTRYVGAGGAEGWSAWVFDSSTGDTTRIGFFDEEHTRHDGYQVSHASASHGVGLRDRTLACARTAARRAIGEAPSPRGYTTREQRRRRGSATSTQPTPEPTGTRSATRSSRPSRATSRDSKRFDGATDHGRSAWLYDVGSATTTRLGYFDAAHTRNDGFQSSTVNHLTESGYAAGGSARYAAATPSGRDLMDLRREQPEPARHRALRAIGRLCELVHRFPGRGRSGLGSYELFAEDDTSLGYRAFAWTPDDGAFDLGALVLGG